MAIINKKLLKCFSVQGFIIMQTLSSLKAVKKQIENYSLKTIIMVMLSTLAELIKS